MPDYTPIYDALEEEYQKRYAIAADPHVIEDRITTYDDATKVADQASALEKSDPKYRYQWQILKAVPPGTPIEKEGMDDHYRISVVRVPRKENWIGDYAPDPMALAEDAAMRLGKEMPNLDDDTIRAMAKWGMDKKNLLAIQKEGAQLADHTGYESMPAGMTSLGEGATFLRKAGQAMVVPEIVAGAIHGKEKMRDFSEMEKNLGQAHPYITAATEAAGTVTGMVLNPLNRAGMRTMGPALTLGVQSGASVAAQNIAEGRPITENVGEAAFTGAAMGATLGLSGRLTEYLNKLPFIAKSAALTQITSRTIGGLSFAAADRLLTHAEGPQLLADAIMGIGLGGPENKASERAKAAADEMAKAAEAGKASREAAKANTPPVDAPIAEGPPSEIPRMASSTKAVYDAAEKAALDAGKTADEAHEIALNAAVNVREGTKPVEPAAAKTEHTGFAADKNLMPSDEAARVLDTDESRLKRLVEEGELKAYHEGGKMWFRRASIDDLLALKNPEPAKPDPRDEIIRKADEARSAKEDELLGDRAEEWRQTLKNDPEATGVDTRSKMEADLPSDTVDQLNAGVDRSAIAKDMLKGEGETAFEIIAQTIDDLSFAPESGDALHDSTKMDTLKHALDVADAAGIPERQFVNRATAALRKEGSFEDPRGIVEEWVSKAKGKPIEPPKTEAPASPSSVSEAPKTEPVKIVKTPIEDPVRKGKGWVASDGTEFSGEGAKARARARNEQIAHKKDFEGATVRSYGGGKDKVLHVEFNESGRPVYTVRNEAGDIRTHSTLMSVKDIVEPPEGYSAPAPKSTPVEPVVEPKKDGDALLADRMERVDQARDDGRSNLSGQEDFDSHYAKASDLVERGRGRQESIEILTDKNLDKDHPAHLTDEEAGAFYDRAIKNSPTADPFTPLTRSKGRTEKTPEVQRTEPTEDRFKAARSEIEGGLGRPLTREEAKSLGVPYPEDAPKRPGKHGERGMAAVDPGEAWDAIKRKAKATMEWFPGRGLESIFRSSDEYAKKNVDTPFGPPPSRRSSFEIATDISSAGQKTGLRSMIEDQITNGLVEKLRRKNSDGSKARKIDPEKLKWALAEENMIEHGEPSLIGKEGNPFKTKADFDLFEPDLREAMDRLDKIEAKIDKDVIRLSPDRVMDEDGKPLPIADHIAVPGPASGKRALLDALREEGSLVFAEENGKHPSVNGRSVRGQGWMKFRMESADPDNPRPRIFIDNSGSIHESKTFFVEPGIGHELVSLFNLAPREPEGGIGKALSKGAANLQMKGIVDPIFHGTNVFAEGMKAAPHMMPKMILRAIKFAYDPLARVEVIERLKKVGGARDEHVAEAKDRKGIGKVLKYTTDPILDHTVGYLQNAVLNHFDLAVREQLLNSAERAVAAENARRGKGNELSRLDALKIKRDMVLRAGNYNKLTTDSWTRVLKNWNVQPFIVAAKTMTANAWRMSPLGQIFEAKARWSRGDRAGAMYGLVKAGAYWASALGAIAFWNSAVMGQDAFPKGIPFGAIYTGRDEDGNPQWNETPSKLLGVWQALKYTGAQQVMDNSDFPGHEGRGDDAEHTLGRAVGDIFKRVGHTAIGPGFEAALVAGGYEVSDGIVRPNPSKDTLWKAVSEGSSLVKAFVSGWKYIANKKDGNEEEAQIEKSEVVHALTGGILSDKRGLSEGDIEQRNLHLDEAHDEAGDLIRRAKEISPDKREDWIADQVEKMSSKMTEEQFRVFVKEVKQRLKGYERRRDDLKPGEVPVADIPGEVERIADGFSAAKDKKKFLSDSIAKSGKGLNKDQQIDIKVEALRKLQLPTDFLGHPSVEECVRRLVADIKQVPLRERAQWLSEEIQGYRMHEGFTKDEVDAIQSEAMKRLRR